MVDPALKGKVKITVIATGFGAQVGDAPASTPARTTPVDMTPYTEQARVRARCRGHAGGAGDAARRRLSIDRRPLLDLPLGAAGGSASAAGVAGRPSCDEALPSDMKKPDVEPRLRVCRSTFDVPAFLRRQEG